MARGERRLAKISKLDQGGDYEVAHIEEDRLLLDFMKKFYREWLYGDSINIQQWMEEMVFIVDTIQELRKRSPRWFA